MESGRELIGEGRRSAAHIGARSSRFCAEAGVVGEVGYKQRAKASGEVMYHAHIGLADWPATEAALIEIHEALSEQGHRLHRYGLCISRAMGMPDDRRAGFPKETGPMLAPGDWQRVTDAAPVHPHLGDNMIGTPNSLALTLDALAAGGTTIGNLGQFFSFEWPGFGDVALTEATVRSLGALSTAPGALAHSYLDDGVAMQLPHYGAYVGWAALEVYIVEQLCGVRLGHSFGGLIDRPLHRAVVTLALDDIRDGDSIGTMIYGNTVDMRRNAPDHNRAVLAASALVDIATQLHRPTGHAIHVTPLTEAERIPTSAENVEVQLLAREIEREARRSADLFDWNGIERLAASCAEYAIAYRDRALARLADRGLDVTDPAALLLALRQLGPVDLDALVSLTPSAEVGRLEPWKASLMTGLVDRIDHSLPRLDGVRVVLAVLEVHDVVRDALARALPRQGAEVIVLPTNATPEGIAQAAVEEDADGVVVGVYNGSALTIARRLHEACERQRWSGLTVFGGLLNEDEGGAVPVDVHGRIEELGIRTVSDIEELAPLLATLRD